MTSNVLKCGCAVGVHPDAGNQMQGAAEREGPVCQLGWPLSMREAHVRMLEHQVLDAMGRRQPIVTIHQSQEVAERFCERVQGLLGSSVRISSAVDTMTTPQGKEHMRTLATSLLKVGDAIRTLERAADAASIALEALAAHGVTCDDCGEIARDQVAFVPVGKSVKIICGSDCKGARS